MNYFKNYEIANFLQVSQATVGKWIKAAQQGKLGLKLESYDSKFYIADTSDNMKTMRSLAERRRKYRNSKAAQQTKRTAPQLAGIWRSDYTYHNSRRNEELKTFHYVRLYPKGNGLVMETIPSVNEAHMRAEFSIAGNIATCNWRESTSLQGDYAGAMYHGAGQLIVSRDGKRMTGKWIGFGKNMEVKVGPWEFTFIGDDMSILDGLEVAPGQ